MKTVVLKYGGSSLSNPEKIRSVASQVVERKRQGYAVAVVVSAMGDTTNSLLGLARSIANDLAPRELDMLLTAGEQISMALLSMAIVGIGERAVSLTGPQAGIITCQSHNRARIVEIRPERVKSELSRGQIVVVAGFQGLSQEGEVTTLGRGGSDTSAVALAAALGASFCEICSDVDGVYSADPRVVADAFPLAQVSYEEMLEMARCGARVLNADAVKMAAQAKLEIRARSSFEGGAGTVIGKRSPRLDGAIAVSGRDDFLWLRFSRAEKQGALQEFFGASQVVCERPGEMLVSGENVANPATFRQRLLQLFPSGVSCSFDVAAVSVVGVKFATGQHTPALEALLSKHDIPILAIFPGGLSSTILVPADRLVEAKRLLHQTYLPREVAA